MPSGFDELYRLLAKVGDAPKVVGAALYQEAQDIMLDSQLIVPVDTGALKSTGIVELPHMSPTERKSVV